MSKYAESQTTLTEGAALVAALRAMGYEVSTSATPQPLNGYQGSQGQSAEIIVLKRGLMTKHGHCFGDIGFTKTADGTYRAIVDDIDRDSYFGESWMGELKQGYTEQRQMATARQRGYVFQGREIVRLPDGKQQVRLQFAAR